MSDTLPLATRLRGMTDAELTAVVRARDIRPSPLKDFFDLAEALLDSASVQQQLARLDRPTLTALAALTTFARDTPVPVTDVAQKLGELGADTTLDALLARFARASQLMLVELSGSDASGDTATAKLTTAEESTVELYTAVGQQLRSWPAFGLPSLEQLAAEAAPAALERVSAADAAAIDRIAADQAFTTTSEISELLAELERGPARELAKGGVALPDTKRLAHAMSVDLEAVSALLGIAIDAGLVARSSGTWCTTDAGGDWMLTTTAERWSALAEGWLGRVPVDIRSLLRDRVHALWSEGLRAFIEWLYPAAGDWISARIAAITQAAERLGITANQAPSTPGTLLIARGAEAAAPAMATLLPAEVDRVYLQHDLSVVAPGPLIPQLDARLRSLADVESRALASTWRISTASMNRAMAAGETAKSLREFLSTISLTGITQPLNYLIGEVSSRYGLIRVTPVSSSTSRPGDAEFEARTEITSTDVELLHTMLVDQSLSALGLTRAGDTRLVSRYPLDTVFWNLSDTRYPVAATDASGRIIALQRRLHAKAASASGSDAVDNLIERLRLGSEAQPEETGEAWLARQLDTAIKAKIALTVSIRMPNGSVVDYQLEPASISGGRLRARDRKSAIERTLPVSSIAGIAPALEP